MSVARVMNGSKLRDQSAQRETPLRSAGRTHIENTEFEQIACNTAAHFQIGIGLVIRSITRSTHSAPTFGSLDDGNPVGDVDTGVLTENFAQSSFAAIVLAYGFPAGGNAAVGSFLVRPTALENLLLNGNITVDTSSWSGRA